MGNFRLVPLSDLAVLLVLEIKEDLVPQSPWLSCWDKGGSCLCLHLLLSRRLELPFQRCPRRATFPESNRLHLQLSSHSVALGCRSQAAERQQTRIQALMYMHQGARK